MFVSYTTCTFKFGTEKAVIFVSLTLVKHVCHLTTKIKIHNFGKTLLKLFYNLKHIE